jgi:hypothetical protein
MVLFNELVIDSLYPRRSNTDLIRWLAIGSIAGQLTWVVIAVARFDLFGLLGGLRGLLIVAGNEPGGHYRLIQRFALLPAGSGSRVLTVGVLVVRSPGGFSALAPATRHARRTGT